MFGMSYGLDNKPIVSREIKEGTRFARGAEFRENVFGGERQEVIGRIKLK